MIFNVFSVFSDFLNEFKRIFRTVPILGTPKPATYGGVFYLFFPGSFRGRLWLFDRFGGPAEPAFGGAGQYNISLYLLQDIAREDETSNIHCNTCCKTWAKEGNTTIFHYTCCKT